MNYIPLLALILGMISVIITLKYIQSYDNLSKNVFKLKQICSGNKNIPTSIIKIQDKLDISDKKLNKLIDKNSEQIYTILDKSNKEKFTNYPLETFTNYTYLDGNQRDIGAIKLYSNIKSNECPKNKIKSYNDEIEYSKKKSLELSTPINNTEVFKPLTYEVTQSKYGLKYNFNKTNYCAINYDDKTYCFDNNNPKLCPSGVIYNNRKHCDF